MAGKLKAYIAHDGDEQTVIVFSSTGIAARRMAANKMGVDFSDVDYCRRAQWADRYAEHGHVPFEAQFEMGWWRECDGCGQRIELDAYDDETDEPIEFDIVENDHGVFCAPACFDDEMARRAEVERLKGLAIEHMERRLLKLAPGATICGKPHVYVSASGRGRFKVEQVSIEFYFPGSVISNGKFRINRDTGRRPVFYICNGDNRAFQLWRAAGYPAHMMDAAL